MLEKIPPDMSCEYWITITNDGLWKSMKVNNISEECSGARGSCVWVSKRDEMSKLRESVHHCQNDAFAVDLWKAFNEVD